nr:bacteriocin family protein [Actinomycetota bacterium]
ALSEFKVSFTVEVSRLQDAERGAIDVDYADLDRAAGDAALIENRAIFHGWSQAGITGIVEASAHPTMMLGATPDYPDAIAQATDILRQAGIQGPYCLLIDPQGYTDILATTEHGGYPLQQHLSSILGGDLVRAPGLDGALVASKRRGDFILDIGQDFAIGYTSHNAEQVTLYLEESFSFRVAEPDAAVVLARAN